MPADGKKSGAVPHRADAVAGQPFAWLLSQSHLIRPGDVTAALAEAARALGLSAPCVYLADMQQRHLMPLPEDDEQASQGQAAAEPLLIETSTAGQAYRAVEIKHVLDPQASRDRQNAYRVWVPLADGADLLGVLGLTAADTGEDTLARCRALASLTGLMVTAKARVSDTYARAQRSKKMSLQGEMIWALLPPRAFATEHVLLSAFLEPAYEAGGDGFDYSMLGDRLHVSLFDALGHDLSAGLLTSVCLASCRGSRRSGGSLADMAARADRAIVSQFSDYRFVTALLAELDVGTGRLSWVCRGHPAPLLIRGDRTVTEFTRPPELPLGLSVVDAEDDDDDDAIVEATLHTEQLQPGDRVLFYTDGVTEGHTTGGTPFGVERLGRFVIEHTTAGTPAPEIMRQLNHEIMDHQSGELRDDATVVMVQWEPGHPRRDLTAEPA
ncbi:MAG TPA: PP2C family protein-serine/threonine phosphatase [Streptosporangiaceae bacterium]|nr:PP2C family protein-serine/threonine phosphatase [Streptosporangiaceae bacterium]